MADNGVGDLAFLSDCRTAAMVSPAGSVDWWCVPRIDSPSVFGRLLDPDAGHWSLLPTEPYESERQYADGSLVLRTTYRTASGEARVTDALLFDSGARGHDIGLRSPARLVRHIVGVSGTVTFATEIAPRFEYGLTSAALHGHGRRLVAAAGPMTLLLESTVPVEAGGGTARATFAVGSGQEVAFSAAYRPSYGEHAEPDGELLAPGPPHDVAAALRDAVEDTVQAWRSWTALHQRHEGRHAAEIVHSAVVLQGLTYARSGAVVAAATTSLPEDPGGDRNWDYRFVWLRDLSLTMHALQVATCPDEANRFFRWLTRSIGYPDDRPVPVVFGVEGERDLTERELDHLAGYGGSSPVRIGNDAWRQRQLDVAGEVLDAAVRLRDYLDFDEQTVELLVGLAGSAHRDWRKPDAGMWEARDAERHYLSSKVLSWVALDRALSLAPLLGEGADVELWTAERDEIRATVLREGWQESVGAYTGAFGSDELDASVLILPLIGFLDATDPRMRATIDVIERKLGADGVVRRWAAENAGFTLCNFWLVECLVLAGEPQRAREWYDRTVDTGGALGLLAEQIDPGSGGQLGNTPQAFSHVGLINAAWRLDQGD